MGVGDTVGTAGTSGWLGAVATRRFEGTDEPAWLDELTERAEDVDEALVTLVTDLPADGETVLAEIAIGLSRWWRVTGQIRTGCDWLRRIQPLCPGNARLAAVTTQLLVSAGRLDAALESATSAGDDELALVCRGQIAVIRADYPVAEALLRRAAASSDPEVVFEATLGLGQAATRQQHFAELATLATKAQRLAWESGLDRQLAAALLLGYSSHWLQGRHVAAAAAANEALEVATAARATTVMAVALGALGGLRLEDGDIYGARELFGRSLALTANGGDVRTTLVTSNNLGETERRAGNTAEARRLFAASLRSAKTLGDDRAVGFMLTALAELALADGDPLAAAEPLRDALELRRSVSDRRGVVSTLEEVVSWAAASGRGREALQLLGAADAARLELATVRDPQLTEPLEQAVTATDLTAAERVEARELGATLDLDGATDLAIELLGGRPVATSFDAEDRRSVAELQLLGGFSLTIEGTVVDARAWQSRKARDLFKILGVARGHPVTRESVMDALWPDADPAALPPRLSVALSTLRSVLGPAREAVIADRDALALDLTMIEIDLVVFHRLADAGEHRLAVERYSGELLPGDLFAEWTTLPRESAAATFVVSAHHAAEESAAARRTDEATLLCRRILATDPYDERAHRRLVRLLRRNGAHGEARRAHEDYVERMTEIGVRVATPAG